MDSPFFSSKVALPPLDERTVARPELTERFNEILRPGLRLALVSAPAGYGKTTLVSQWISLHRLTSAQTRFAWFGIEPADNDPLQFYSYAIRAIQQILPEFGQKSMALSQNPQAFQPALAASLLASELAEINHPLVLVLDDYHLIHEQSIHEGLTVWLDHIPAQIHLVLISRSDPALPLHRYRARGQMIEFRQGDLRFDREETLRFVESRLQTTLTQADLDLLEERIEGWPAGLQMAAIRIHTAPDAHPILDALAGNQRFILDYLAEEVFNAQPADVQQFLLCTALLDRFNPDQIDSIANQPSTSERDSRAIIRFLEDSNLFIVPLDRAQEWYRYHHLFRDLLLLKFKHKSTILLPEASRIYGRAADWFLERGWMSEAIQACIQGGHFEQAASLVEQHTIQLFAEGQLHALLSWIRLLPAELAEQRPWLCLYRAWAAVFAGRFEDTRSALDQLTTLLPVLENREQTMALEYEARAIRAILAITTADIPTAFKLTEIIEPASSPARQFAESVLTWCKGYALRMTGQVLPAVDLFHRVVEIGQQNGNAWTILSGSVDYGQVLRLTGQLDEAETVFRRALEQIQNTRHGQGFIGRLESFLAAVLLEKDQLEEAYRLARAGVEHNRSWENPNHIVYGHLILAKVLLALGNPAEAEHWLAESEQICQSGKAIPPLRASIQAAQIRLRLKEGQTEAGQSWLSHHPPAQGPAGETQLVEATTRARIWMAAGRPEDAYGLLHALLPSLRETGQISWQIDLLCLMALSAPDESTAREHLLDAVNLGIPRGFRRFLLEDGPELLARLSHNPSAELGAGVEPVIRTMSVRYLPEPAATARAQAAVGPLTTRELEILALVARGLSNQQIGTQLYISAGTVKAHTAAIFRKLDAANRAEAVSRAKDLRLV